MPNNWKTYKLGEFGSFKNGANFSRKDFGDGHPVINVKNLFRGRFVTTDDLPNIKTGVIKNISANRVAKNDLLFARSSLKASGTGQVAIVDNLPIADTLFSGFIIRYRIERLGNLDPMFLNYYLRGPRARAHFESIGTGTTITNLTQDTLANIEVVLPPLPEQQAIASILSSLDDKIELNLQMNKTLEEMAMTLYKHWFVDFGPFQGGEFVDSELGKIPKGWEVEKFGNLIDKIIDNRGKTPPLSPSITDYLLFETYQLTRERFFPIDSQSNKAKYVSSEIYNNAKWFRKGHPEYLDILFATVGNGIPNWSLMFENNGIGIAQNVVGIRCKKNIPPLFLLCSFESNLFLNQFDGYIITTAQPSIKLSDLRRINMIQPTNELLNKWNKLTLPLLESNYSNYMENKNLTILRDTLLPKLISGEVRVKEAERMVGEVV